MRVAVMDHFGLARDLRAAGYFETEHHQQLLRELESAIRQGGLIALGGIVGCGKTTLLWQLQDRLKKAGTFHVAESLAVDVNRVNLNCWPDIRSSETICVARHWKKSVRAPPYSNWKVSKASRKPISHGCWRSA